MLETEMTITYTELLVVNQPGAYLRVPTTLFVGVLNFWDSTIGCWIIEEFVCYTLKFAYFSTKQTDFSYI